MCDDVRLVGWFGDGAFVRSEEGEVVLRDVWRCGTWLGPCEIWHGRTLIGTMLVCAVSFLVRARYPPTNKVRGKYK